MAVTDAFSTSLKMIGVAADIYAGRWDGSKYKDEPAENPKGCTETQNKAINALLATKNADGTFVFSAEEKKTFTKWRTQHTSVECIEFLEKKIKKRKGDDFPEDIPYDETPLTPEEEAKANTAFETN